MPSRASCRLPSRPPRSNPKAARGGFRRWTPTSPWICPCRCLWMVDPARVHCKLPPSSLCRGTSSPSSPSRPILESSISKYHPKPVAHRRLPARSRVPRWTLYKHEQPEYSPTRARAGGRARPLPESEPRGFFIPRHFGRGACTPHTPRITGCCQSQQRVCEAFPDRIHIPRNPYDSSVLRLIDCDGAPGGASNIDDDTIELMYLTDDPQQQSGSDVTDLHRQFIHT